MASHPMIRVIGAIATLSSILGFAGIKLGDLGNSRWDRFIPLLLVLVTLMMLAMCLQDFANAHQRGTISSIASIFGASFALLLFEDMLIFRDTILMVFHLKAIGLILQGLLFAIWNFMIGSFIFGEFLRASDHERHWDVTSKALLCVWWTYVGIISVYGIYVIHAILELIRVLMVRQP